MQQNRQLHRDLQWTPALWFTIHEQITVFVEPSESSVYPRIFELKRQDVVDFRRPITVYAVCPREILGPSGHQSEVKRLERDGFGLISVDSGGTAKREVPAIPLIQIIPKPEIDRELRGLPQKMRQRISEAFEDYCNKPVNGVRSLSEVVEGLVVQAGKDAVKQQYIQKADIGHGVAKTLDALFDSQQLKNARAQIGGVRSYINAYRNVSHHWPKNAKEGYQKYSDCRHGFLDGIKQIHRFRPALKKVGLSGNLPKA